MADISLTIQLTEEKYKTLCMEAERVGSTPEELASKAVRGKIVFIESCNKLNALEDERRKGNAV